MKFPWQKKQPKSTVDSNDDITVAGKRKVRRNARGQVLAGYAVLNPAGKPKGRTWKGILNGILDCTDPETQQTYRELLAMALIGKGLQGEATHAQIVMERTEGKVSQDVNLGGTDKPLVLKIVRDDGSSAGSSAESLS